MDVAVSSWQPLPQTCLGVPVCLDAAPNFKHLTFKTIYIYKGPTLLFEKTLRNVMLEEICEVKREKKQESV